MPVGYSSHIRRHLRRRHINTPTLDNALICTCKTAISVENQNLSAGWTQYSHRRFQTDFHVCISCVLCFTELECGYHFQIIAARRSLQVDLVQQLPNRACDSSPRQPTNMTSLDLAVFSSVTNPLPLSWGPQPCQHRLNSRRDALRALLLLLLLLLLLGLRATRT